MFIEVIEMSLEHKLPHFIECWWDHLFTDILLSNTPALLLGFWVLDKLKWRRFDWLGRWGT